MDKLLICSYNNFDLLAHKVKGTQSSIPITIVKNNIFWYIDFDNFNPAFVIRRGKYIYVCCESIHDGYILTIGSLTTSLIFKV